MAASTSSRSLHTPLARRSRSIPPCPATSTQPAPTPPGQLQHAAQLLSAAAARASTSRIPGLTPAHAAPLADAAANMERQGTHALPHGTAVPDALAASGSSPPPGGKRQQELLPTLHTAAGATASSAAGADRRSTRRAVAGSTRAGLSSTVVQSPRLPAVPPPHGSSSGLQRLQAARRSHLHLHTHLLQEANVAPQQLPVSPKQAALQRLKAKVCRLRSHGDNGRR